VRVKEAGGQSIPQPGKRVSGRGGRGSGEKRREKDKDEDRNRDQDKNRNRRRRECSGPIVTRVFGGVWIAGSRVQRLISGAQTFGAGPLVLPPRRRDPVSRRGPGPACDAPCRPVALPPCRPAALSSCRLCLAGLFCSCSSDCCCIPPRTSAFQVGCRRGRLAPRLDCHLLYALALPTNNTTALLPPGPPAPSIRAALTCKFAQKLGMNKCSRCLEDMSRLAS
jgi:hypothetical protein